MLAGLSRTVVARISAIGIAVAILLALVVRDCHVRRRTEQAQARADQLSTQASALHAENASLLAKYEALKATPPPPPAPHDPVVLSESIHIPVSADPSNLGVEDARKVWEWKAQAERVPGLEAKVKAGEELIDSQQAEIKIREEENRDLRLTIKGLREVNYTWTIGIEGGLNSKGEQSIGAFADKDIGRFSIGGSVSKTGNNADVRIRLGLRF